MIYFISDVHLGVMEREEDRKREELLLKFLDEISFDCESLILMGDIFDYWFEYKTVIPRYFYRTLNKLSELRDKGIKIEFIMGNHDFGHKDFFEKELTIPVHCGDIERTYSNKKFYISHGDGKATKDYGYKILKKVLRNRFAQFLFNLLHPDFGIKLASFSSRKSRFHTDHKDYGKHDGMAIFAEKKINEGFDYVLMGHRHKAEVQKIGEGLYIDTGEWIFEPTYAVFDGRELKLHKVQSLINPS